MNNFNIFLQELVTNTDIKLRLIDEEENVIFGAISDDSNEQITTFSVVLGESNIKVQIPKRFEGSQGVLKYIIESKYRELYSIKEQGFMDILEGREVSNELLTKNFSFIEKGSNVMIIDVDGNKYDALTVIKEIYKEQDVISIIFGDHIVLMGIFEDIEEHASSIIESIEADIYYDSCISYSDTIYKAKEVKKAYENCKECLMLKSRYSIKQNILSYNKLLLEKLVYFIKDDLKNELKEKLEDKFNSFDEEMLTTIEEFINYGLNISDAARRLYIHRNTLIYRLDKIKRETGYDIRNFKEATLFIIAYLIWKEK
ncbi:PucR family transcriptional regulator [Clostridium cellulovorans]|uniref:Putative transcriptional regulator, PucR family n=1 Tax=Clostridium cellulovorans (strain ATCC 35296 / DSM 3052 / OCM 3 / 743B) TaxID=573061 RepID=D9SKV2_CLOC7|nr:helix-turn-helix domain-containing protein [Clostridium cellulovorans]ADL53524.1 putative transcriptional regulator, PucR family [Clostridium cellulovorans 743B]